MAGAGFAKILPRLIALQNALFIKTIRLPPVIIK